MKKIILTIICAFMTFGLFAWDGGYDFDCPGCKWTMINPERTWTGNRSHAHRVYGSEEAKYKAMVYHCNHGHKFSIPYSSDPHTRDYSEITMIRPDDSTWKLNPKYFK